MSTREVTGFEVESEDVYGDDEGFLRVRRFRLRNRRSDGSRSDRFICDFLGRPKGPDAVVLVLYHQPASGAAVVLLREGLRPALALGRPAEELPVPDTRPYLRFMEVVAGIIEREDQGELGIRQRAAIEAFEEAGYRIDAQAVTFLGAGTFPSPGSMPEKFWLTAAHIADPAACEPPPGDGSPMEEGARTQWVRLDEAVQWCVEGRIEDCKTEIALRRLQARLREDDVRL